MGKKKKEFDPFDEDFSLEGLDNELSVDMLMIDTDKLALDAQADAKKTMEDLMDASGDAILIESNPKLLKRLKIESDNLQTLMKMKASNDIVHDLLVKSVGRDPGNASLYASLNKIQTAMMSIQKQIIESVKNIEALLKERQNTVEENSDNIFNVNKTESISGITTRGNKQFIQQMLSDNNSEQKIFEA